MTTDDIGRAKVRIRGTLAQQLLTGAQLIKSRDQMALARRGPPASRPGEYPKRRTGRLLASVDFGPKTLAEIDRIQRVTVFRKAFYDKFLVGKGRRSVQDTVNQYRGQLAAMFGGGGLSV